MEAIGLIAEVQIQTDSLKRGERSRRVYDPTHLLAVPAIRLSAAGVVGLIDGRELLDRHHRAHANSGRRESNGISFNFTSHYAAIHARYGDAAAPGSGGENILIRSDRQFDLADLAAGVVIVTLNGRHVPIGEISYITPCVPFSNYVHGLAFEGDGALMKETLQFLNNGPRGFYGECLGEPVVIRPGDRVYRKVAELEKE